MASIQTVGIADNSGKLRHQKISSGIDAGLLGQFLKGRHFSGIIPGDKGNGFPFRMGKADNLVAHNDIVGTLGNEIHADIFSHIMEHHGDPQQQPLPLSQAVNSLHGVEDGHGCHFHILNVGAVYRVPLADILGSHNNIIFKVVLYLQQLLLLRVFIGEASGQMNARGPDHGRPHLFNEAVINNSGGAQQGGVFHRHIHGHSQFHGGMLHNILIPGVKIASGNCTAGLVLRVPEDSICNKIADQHNILDLPVFQIHALEA